MGKESAAWLRSNSQSRQNCSASAGSMFEWGSEMDGSGDLTTLAFPCGCFVIQTYKAESNRTVTKNQKQMDEHRAKREVTLFGVVS